MSEKFTLTEEGLKNLQDELYQLKNVDRVKNITALQEARAQGDLSENADYDAAREQQREIERKIKELENTLKNAVVITITTTNLGRKIKFEVIGADEPDLFGNGEFLLVSSVESNPFDANMPKISNESQLGAALMRAKVGDIIQISNDDVSYSVKVINIE